MPVPAATHLRLLDAYGLYITIHTLVILALNDAKEPGRTAQAGKNTGIETFDRLQSMQPQGFSNY